MGDSLREMGGDSNEFDVQELHAHDGGFQNSLEGIPPQGWQKYVQKYAREGTRERILADIVHKGSHIVPIALKMNNVPCGLFLGEKGRMQHLRRDQRVKAACYLCCCDGCMGKDLSDIRALCNVNPCGQDCSTRWTVSCRIDCVDDAGGCVVRLAGAVALPSNPVGELLVTGRVVDFKTMAAHWGLDARKSQGETFVDTDGAFLSMWLSSKDKQAGAATSGAVSGGCDPKTKLASHDNAKLFLATLEKPDDLQGTPAPPGHSGQTGQELGGLGICAGDGGAGGAAIAPSGALPGPTMGAVPAFNFGPLPVPASVGPGPHGNAPAAEMVSAHAARHLSVASAAGPAPAPQEPAPSMPHTPGAAVADAVQGEPAADLHYGNNPVRILQQPRRRPHGELAHIWVLCCNAKGEFPSQLTKVDYATFKDVLQCQFGPGPLAPPAIRNSYKLFRSWSKDYYGKNIYCDLFQAATWGDIQGVNGQGSGMTWQSCFGIEGNVRDALVDLIQLVNLEDGFLDRLGEATDLEDEKLQRLAREVLYRDALLMLCKVDLKSVAVKHRTHLLARLPCDAPNAMSGPLLEVSDSGPGNVGLGLERGSEWASGPANLCASGGGGAGPSHGKRARDDGPGSDNDAAGFHPSMKRAHADVQTSLPSQGQYLRETVQPKAMEWAQKHVIYPPRPFGEAVEGERGGEEGAAGSSLVALEAGVGLGDWLAQQSPPGGLVQVFAKAPGQDDAGNDEPPLLWWPQLRPAAFVQHALAASLAWALEKEGRLLACSLEGAGVTRAPDGLAELREVVLRGANGAVLEREAMEAVLCVASQLACRDAEAQRAVVAALGAGGWVGWQHAAQRLVVEPLRALAQGELGQEQGPEHVGQRVGEWGTGQSKGGNGARSCYWVVLSDVALALEVCRGLGAGSSVRILAVVASKSDALRRATVPLCTLGPVPLAEGDLLRAARCIVPSLSTVAALAAKGAGDGDSELWEEEEEVKKGSDGASRDETEGLESEGEERKAMRGLLERVLPEIPMSQPRWWRDTSGPRGSKGPFIKVGAHEGGKEGDSEDAQREQATEYRRQEEGLARAIHSRNVARDLLYPLVLSQLTNGCILPRIPAFDERPIHKLPGTITQLQDLYLADYLHRQHTLAQARANKQNRLEARSQRNLWTLRKEPSTWENTPVRLRLPSKNEVSFGPLRMQLRQHARVEELLQGHPGGKATAPRRLTRYLPRVAHLASCLCYWSERAKVQREGCVACATLGLACVEVLMECISSGEAARAREAAAAREAVKDMILFMEEAVVLVAARALLPQFARLAFALSVDNAARELSLTKPFYHIMGSVEALAITSRIAAHLRLAEAQFAMDELRVGPREEAMVRRARELREAGAIAGWGEVSEAALAALGWGRTGEGQSSAGRKASGPRGSGASNQGLEASSQGAVAVREASGVVKVRDGRPVEERTLSEVIKAVPVTVENLPRALRALWDAAAGGCEEALQWRAFASQAIASLRKSKRVEKLVRLKDDLSTQLAPWLVGEDGSVRAERLYVLAKLAEASAKGVDIDDVTLEMCMGVAHEAKKQAVKDGKQGKGDGGIVREGDANVEWDVRAKGFLSDTYERLAFFRKGSRDWVVQEVDRWLEGPAENDRRMFLLLALPGMGKTALSACLADRIHRRGQLLAGHFCVAGDASRTDPASIVMSLAAQVRCADVPGLCGRINAARHSLQGHESPSDLCRLLLAEPLASVSPDSTAAAPVVLIIDAVDEGGVDAASNGVLGLLAADLVCLPPHVRILATSRPEPYIVERLRAYGPRTLEPTAEDNLRDVEGHVRASVRESDFVEADREQVVREVLGRSEGVIAYAAAVMRMAQEGPRGLGKLRVGELPRGHRRLYDAYLARSFGGGRLSVGADEALRASLLPALAVAREPIHVRDLRWLMGPGVEEEDKNAAIGALGSLFPVDQKGLVRPFHKSVVDWLLSDSDSSWFFGGPLVGHAVHARAWVTAVADAGSKGHARDLSTELGAYCARHAVAHAAGGGDGLLGASAGALQQWPHWAGLGRLGCSLTLTRAAADVGALSHHIRSVLSAQQLMMAASGGELASALRGWAERLHDVGTWLGLFAPAMRDDPCAVPDCAAMAPAVLREWWAEDGVDLTAGVRMRVTRPMSRLPLSRVFPSAAPCLDLAFDTHGHVLAGASEAGNVLCWDAATGAPLPPLRVSGEPLGNATALAFSADGTMLAAGGSCGACAVWDTVSRAQVAWLVGHTGPVTGVAFSPDAWEGWARLVTSSMDGTCRVWALGTWECAQVLKRQSPVQCVAVSMPMGRWLAAGTSAGEVAVWPCAEAVADRPLHSLRVDRDASPVMRLAFAEHGRTLAAGRASGAVDLWAVASGQRLSSVPAHGGSVRGLCAAGSLLVDVGDDGKVVVVTWDAPRADAGLVAGQRVMARSTLLGTLQHPALACAMPSDGATLAVAVELGSVRMWDGPALAAACDSMGPAERGPDPPATAHVYLSDHGHGLLVASRGGRVRVLHPVSMEVVADLGVLEHDHVHLAALSDDGGSVLVCWETFSLSVFRIGSGSTTRVFRTKPQADGHNREILAACFFVAKGVGADGALRVATSAGLGGDAGEVKVWDASDGAGWATVEGRGHVEGVRAPLLTLRSEETGGVTEWLVASPHDHGFVTGSRSGHVMGWSAVGEMLWKVRSEKPHLRLFTRKETKVEFDEELLVGLAVRDGHVCTAALDRRGKALHVTLYEQPDAGANDSSRESELQWEGRCENPAWPKAFRGRMHLCIDDRHRPYAHALYACAAGSAGIVLGVDLTTASAVRTFAEVDSCVTHALSARGTEVGVAMGDAWVAGSKWPTVEDLRGAWEARKARSVAAPRAEPPEQQAATLLASLSVMSQSPPALAQQASREGRRLVREMPGRLVHAGDAECYDVAFSRRRPGLMATSGKDGVVRLWDMADGGAAAGVLVVGSDLLSVDFAFWEEGSGDVLAVGGASGVAWVWDVGGSCVLQRLSGAQQRVFCVRFSPARPSLLAGGTEAGELVLWDWPSNRIVHTMRGHTDLVHCVAFNSAGDVVASAGHDSTVRLWDVDSGAPLHVLAEHGGFIWGLAWGGDGTGLLLSGGGDWNRQDGGDCAIRVWDTMGAREGRVPRVVRRMQGSATRSLSGLSVSPHDSNLLASTHWDQRTRVWRISDGAELAVAQEEYRNGRRWMRATQWSPDDPGVLVSCGGDGEARAWRLVGA